MGHRATHIHRFRCDADCDSKVEVKRRSVTSARAKLRQDGWSVRWDTTEESGEEYFCPIHNTKDSPECPECGSVLISAGYASIKNECRLCGHRWEADE